MNTSQAGQGQFKVELISPPTVKSACRCNVQELAPQEYRVQFTPQEAGQYQLRVLFNNKLVQGKPLITDVQPLPPINPSPPATLARLQQLHPNGPPEIGDEISLQSNEDLLLDVERSFFGIFSHHRTCVHQLDSRSHL